MLSFEMRANNIQIAIEAAGQRIEDFGYTGDSKEEAVSRVVGMFITWLTSSEEARHQIISSNASYRKNVINILPNIDDPTWDDYIKPRPNSTLKERAEALWGIRVAFTHGDGDINLITNSINKQYAINAANIFNGVSIIGSQMTLSEGLYHEAIRTMVQIQDIV